MINSMEKLRRISLKYDKGIMDAVAGIYKPGFTFGVFREAYKKGHSQGCKMGSRGQKLIKTK